LATTGPGSSNRDKPYYAYAGPHCAGDVHGGSGHTTDLMFRSQFYYQVGSMGDPYTRDPHYWGVSVKNKWMRAMSTCPSLMRVFMSDFAAEPHENQPRTTDVGAFAQGAGHWNLRRRNVLYNDGHVEYLKLNHHPPD
jgi:prepilin-type processing-associated H-X9-DG protein